MQFRYDCVNPNSLEELEYIVDNSEEITYKEFIDAIGEENYETLLSFPYFKVYREGYLELEKDWSVSFFKSELEYKSDAYFVCHSAIEYVFY